MVMGILKTVSDAVMANKVITILSVALLAFVISTTVLAVENNDKAAEIKGLRLQLAGKTTEASTTTTESIQTTTVPAPATTTPSMETTPADTTTPTTSAPTTEAPTDNYRLPEDNIPLHYDLYLHPHLENGTFSGKVVIEVQTIKQTDSIVLHSYNLTIGRVQISSSNTTLTYLGTNVDSKKDFLQLRVSQTLQPTFISKVTIEFTGHMDDKIFGLYSSSYKAENNSSVKIATSKFEPTYARQAFPCFDEPHLKATYTVQLVYPNTNGYHALSNMDVDNTLQNEPSAGLNTAVFKRSVPMSTYLVAFIVSDFKDDFIPITPTLGEPFKLTVFATPFQIENARFARDTAAKVIEHYIDYFRIEYPLPKLDMAAIPDFVSGAMETWGLVTYRETSILYNSKTSSTANKQRVAEVIAHELAHMWFGNLVTMKWWNELWLNEGFASYIEYKGVDHAYDKWGIMEQFALDNLHGVLTLDATLGSHPIVVKVETPNQITEIFDTITYSKGASVIRMLEDFVTEDVFKQGVTAYLTKLKYGNGESKDLMDELDKLFRNSTQPTVTQVMDTFTKQKGFPVITVERVANQYRLRQSRFLADPAANETAVSEFNYKWYVPLTYILSTNSTAIHRKWFPNTEEVIAIDAPTGTDSWIKLNCKQVGYYRVNYPEGLWQKFAELLVANRETFNIGDRTGLLNDAFALADASHIKYNLALGLTKFLVDETEYVPWATVSSKLKTIRNLIYDYPSYDVINIYVRQLVQKVYNSVGWQVSGDDHMKNRLRTTVLDLACSFGDEGCLNEAYNLFRSWLDNDVEHHPDIRSVVYFYGMQRSADIKDWEKVKERFHDEIDANEKAKMMSALTAFPDAKVLKRLLDEAWDTSLVRQQDHLNCIQNVAANKHGEQAAWDHVRLNWERLVDRFTLGERNLGRMIPSITGRFSSSVRLMELEDFFRRNPEAGAGASARVQALENISNNIKWLERNEKIIADWLSEAVAPASTGQ